MHQIELRFTGRVQQVGFRYTCQQISRQFEIVGWVRNEPDGSVKVHAEGKINDLTRFADQIVETVNAATFGHVDSVERNTEPIAQLTFDSFSIAR